jgi:predicted HTH transcriptional regulator
MQPEETLMTLVITSSDSSKVSPENIKMSPETDGMSPENAQTSPETNVVSPEMSPENVQTSQKIIELIRNNKNITMQEMANVLGLNKRSVARNIKKLQEHGLIRRVGANKNGYWEISA